MILQENEELTVVNKGTIGLNSLPCCKLRHQKGILTEIGIRYINESPANA